MIKLIIILIFISIQFGDVCSNLRTSFDPFRHLTNQFLRTIQPNTTALNVTINLFILKNNNVTDPLQIFLLYWRPYLGYLILIIIGILFMICFTITGLIFCCCRVCCKKCGANPSARSTKNMKHIRITFNIFLFIFVTLILIGAIIAMASSFVFLEAMNGMDKTSDKSGNLFYGINSTFTSLNGFINKLAQNILTDGINIIRTSLNQALSMFNTVTSTFINTYMSGIDFISFIIAANNFIAQYSAFIPVTVNLSNSAALHEIRGNNFSSYINNINSVLSSTLTDDVCNHTGLCDKVKSLLPNLAVGYNVTNINYEGDKSAANISSAQNISELQNAVNLVSASAVNLLDNVNTSFTGFIRDMINVVNQSRVISNIIQTVNDSILPLQNKLSEFQNSAYSYKLGSNSVFDGGLYNYVYFGFCGVCSLIGVILLLIVLFYIGLSFGVCGAPNFEDPSCCNKGAGSGFLIGSVSISFIFGWLVMLVTMVLFLVGGLLTTEVCSYMNSKDVQQISVIDNLISHYTQSSPLVVGSLVLPKVNLLESVLLRCPDSVNLTSAFQIPGEFLQNTSEHIYTLYVDKPINDTIAAIFNYSLTPIDTSPSERNINNLTQVIQSLQLIVSPITLIELRKPVTKLTNIQDFQNSVNILITNLTNLNNSESANRINNSLYDFTSQLNLMDSTRVTYLTNKERFDSVAVNLNASFFGLSGILNSLKSSLINAKNLAVIASQSQLKDSAKRIINTTVTSFSNSLGDCKGLYESVRTGVNTACSVTVSPLNSIWMGLGWFLLFIIPAIVLAVKLSSIYRISHIESESAAYNHAYMASNQFLSRDDLEMIRLGRPQRI